LHLVGADKFGGLFQVQIVLEPSVEHVAIGVPPARRVRLPGERQESLPLNRVVDAVQREQIGDVAFLKADPAQLHPADLGLGRPDRPAGLVAGHARGQPQRAQARA
jgi:hypothetical protein